MPTGEKGEGGRGVGGEDARRLLFYRTIQEKLPPMWGAQFRAAELVEGPPNVITDGPPTKSKRDDLEYHNQEMRQKSELLEKAEKDVLEDAKTIETQRGVLDQKKALLNVLQTGQENLLKVQEGTEETTEETVSTAIQQLQSSITETERRIDKNRELVMRLKHLLKFPYTIFHQILLHFQEWNMIKSDEGPHVAYQMLVPEANTIMEEFDPESHRIKRYRIGVLKQETNSHRISTHHTTLDIVKPGPVKLEFESTTLRTAESEFKFVTKYLNLNIQSGYDDYDTMRGRTFEGNAYKGGKTFPKNYRFRVRPVCMNHDHYQVERVRELYDNRVPHDFAGRTILAEVEVSPCYVVPVRSIKPPSQANHNMESPDGQVKQHTIHFLYKQIIHVRVRDQYAKESEKYIYIRFVLCRQDSENSRTFPKDRVQYSSFRDENLDIAYKMFDVATMKKEYEENDDTFYKPKKNLEYDREGRLEEDSCVTGLHWEMSYTPFHPLRLPTAKVAR